MEIESHPPPPDFDPSQRHNTLQAIVRRVIFGHRRHLSAIDGDFDVESFAVTVRALRAPGERDFYQVILQNQSGGELVFGLDESAGILRGDDGRQYRVSKEEVASIRAYVG